MAGHEWPHTGPSRAMESGNQYQQIDIGQGAKAHLGDTYIFGRDSPLNLLPYAVEAPFNSYHRQHESTCLRDTRVDILEKIDKWSNGQDGQCIFWLNGMAGTGKSTISRTVARQYFDQDRLGASFFFSRGSGRDVSHAGKFFTTIAAQLAQYAPPLQRYISEAFVKHSNIASQSFDDQWRQLILHPLSKLDGDLHLPYILVIDALDECDNEEHIRTILRLLAEARSLKTARLRIFLTSRPEIPIRHGFHQIPKAEHQDFVLHSIERAIVNHDIAIFVEYNLSIIRHECCLDDNWPGGRAIRDLVHNASGLFIWAETACRFIREGEIFAVERLEMILQGSSISVTAPEKHLDEIYITVLQHSISSKYMDKEKDEAYSRLRHILGSIVVLVSSLSIDSLSRLLHIRTHYINQTLAKLNAILDIPGDNSRSLHLHHPSFHDFLLDRDRCGSPHFWVDEKHAHRSLGENCIQLMSRTLKQDICGQGAPGTLVTDIERSQLEQYLSPAVQYACLYWVEHLLKGGARLSDHDQVHQFLQEHLLHWCEALSWICKASEGILAITSLELGVAASESPALHAFVYDAKRFMMYHRWIIERAPLQLYCSALIFAPERSVVRQQYSQNIPGWVRRLPRTQANWKSMLQTLEGHSERVTAVAFSQDGQRLASGSWDRTVRLWEAATGAALQTLEGHLDAVNDVAFLPDSQRLASGSDDRTVRLWEAATGATLQTLEGHSDGVTAVAFSQDGQRLAPGSDDRTVRLWEAATGAALQTLEGHSSSVTAVAFSRDGQRLASGSWDRTVRLWEAVTGAALQTLEGHSNGVTAVAFSPDGQRLASGSWDGTVRLWEVATGAALKTLEGHLKRVNAVAFSPDGQWLASGSDDRVVWLWEAATGATLQTLEGHSGGVTAVAFSPDGRRLASGSEDRTVRLWEAATEAALQTLEGHSNGVTAVAFSQDGQRLASGSWDGTVRLREAATGAVLQTLEGHIIKVDVVAFSPDGQRLASGSIDGTVWLWEATTGVALQTLEGHSSSVTAVAFSQDGQRLASGSWDRTVRLWEAVTGAAPQTLEGHSDGVTAVAFSQDGQRLASGSWDGTVRLWEVATGAALKTLEGHSSRITAVAFSRDGQRLASGSWDGTVRLWEAATGAALQTLDPGATFHTISFSFDGSYLKTDRGLLSIMALPFEAVRSQPSLLRGVFVTEQWISCGMENLLWLSPDYRPTCTAVYKGIVGLGHASGQVSILELSFNGSTTSPTHLHHG